MFTFPTRTVALLSATALTAVAATGCGSDDSGSSTTTPATTASSTASAAEVDKAFVSQMIPHHQMALEMAGYAPARGQHTQIKELGKSIIASQTTEITEMKAAARRLGATVAEMPSHANGGMNHSVHGGDSMTAAAKTLGIPTDQMGMSMDMGSLAKANPFDRAFIDEMLPHHQGAIVMARAELARGKDPELKKIATAILEAQTKEIKQMNSWRTDWYGAPSPAGGVPVA
ncbi:MULTISPECIES: DUF305 domain-containing protein [Patulibacter]|jgi:uncharacterized protein (DUF305 family)|uniref:Unannotated protein n=1 Tax=freshwater metagenome TaxID=449393 RepID=A0A6J7FYF8_9ZZZZ|nr:DUF305 domain-containing protein [Patulibacter minatonensis]MSW49585.1 DUF305 domain-containing protein [Actinomycetota bacterium]